jgi:hypothetical protein
METGVTTKADKDLAPFRMIKRKAQTREMQKMLAG